MTLLILMLYIYLAPNSAPPPPPSSGPHPVVTSSPPPPPPCEAQSPAQLEEGMRTNMVGMVAVETAPDVLTGEGGAAAAEPEGWSQPEPSRLPPPLRKWRKEHVKKYFS